MRGDLRRVHGQVRPTQGVEAREPTVSNVAYVTMQFPEPSETFASNEVRMLSELGITIDVHGLRQRHPRADQLLRERGIEGLRTTHNGAASNLRGVLAAVVRPSLLLRSAVWIVGSNRRRLRDMALSLVALPRAFDILADVERSRPDVVHMYWGHFPTIVGYLVQHRLPTTVTSVSIVAYDLEREYGGVGLVARRADVVRTHAVVNRDRISRLTGVPHDRISVIYNGVDVAWLRRIAGDYGKTPRRIVAAGRLIAEKGVGDAISAFADVRTRWSDATLVVLGEGPDHPRLERLCHALGVTDAVDFLGHVPHARAAEEMAKAEVLLLLSRSPGERLPNVVKEGMACGCVCITTPTPGIGELVEHGVSGFVVPDSAAASRIIDDLFSGRIDARRLTEHAQAHIVERFDLARTAPEYRRLWNASLHARTARPILAADHHRRRAVVPMANRDVNVLMYHDVVSLSRPNESGFPGPAAATYKVEPQRFEQHLDAIQRRVDTPAATFAGDAATAMTCGWAISFDDGGVTAISEAAPLLEARGWRGLFFVPTQYIGRPGFMDATQLHELRARGHLIGSHSQTHPPRLSSCSRADVRAEWRESLATLGEILGERVLLASVPNGYYSRMVGEEAARAGIEVLFTSEPTSRPHWLGSCLVVGRYAIRSSTSATRAAAIAAGDRVPRFGQWLEWQVKGLVKVRAGDRYLQLRSRLALRRNS
jgi:colanic acid/amylovoran biosynthesis glycosyltransferase